MQYTNLILLPIAAAVVCYVFMGFLLKKFKITSSGYAALVIGLMGTWALTAALEMIFVSYEVKLFIIRIAYVSFTMLMPSWTIFIVKYTTRTSKKTVTFLAVFLYAIFGIFLMFQWFNPNDLFYVSSKIEMIGGDAVFVAEYGILFWVYTVSSYVLVLLAALWMIVSHRKYGLRPRQVITTFAGIFSPIVLNILYVLRVVPYDLTSAGFIVSCVSLFFLYKDEFFAGLPLSRQNAFEAIPVGFVILNSSGKVLEINSHMMEMLCVNTYPKPFASACKIIESWFKEDDKLGMPSFVQSFNHPSRGKLYYRVMVSKSKATAVRTTKEYSILIVQDETTLNTVNQRVQFLERYDDSTGLYNRQYFFNLFDQMLERCVFNSTSLALVTSSIVNYQDISYVYGNEFANHMLHRIGEILNENIRAGDVVCRFSTNEICILLSFENSVLSVKDRCETTMKRIYESFKEPITVNGIKITVKLHSGIAFAPQHALNSSKLVSLAQMARNTISPSVKYPFNYFHEESGTNYSRRIQLEQDLGYALEKQELFVVYQPQVDLRDGRVVGVEALVRWQHPVFGIVPPVEFITIAEENKFINEIGIFVIETAIKQICEWKEDGIDNIKIGINVSLTQLANPNFSREVLDLIAQYGVNPSNMELEITESVAMLPDVISLGHLPKLRQAGVRVAMDDFGMGHSSLSYIKNFEIDTLKIDRVLSCDILTNTASVAMIKSVAMLCEAMGLNTVVEFVEYPAQLKILEDLQCFIVQGYVFSPALNGDACTAYIKNSNNMIKINAPNDVLKEAEANIEIKQKEVKEAKPKQTKAKTTTSKSTKSPKTKTSTKE